MKGIAHGILGPRRPIWSRLDASFVKDIGEAYRQCALVVAPLFEGGGTKIKVLEALRHGRTLVGTQHAVPGYETDFA